MRAFCAVRWIGIAQRAILVLSLANWGTYFGPFVCRSQSLYYPPSLALLNLETRVCAVGWKVAVDASTFQGPTSIQDHVNALAKTTARYSPRFCFLENHPRTA